MLYANQDNTKVLATPFSKATCPYCDEQVIAKCGEIKTWHWAHKNLKECDTWADGETDWHLQWKSYFPREKVEVTIQKNGIKHRADAITHDNTVIEFQHSYISPDKIKEREDFYENMIWIFDAKEAYQAGRISFIKREYEHNDEVVPNAKRYFLNWNRQKTNILFTNKRVILDLDEKTLFLISQKNVVIKHFITMTNGATGNLDTFLNGITCHYAKGSLIDKARFIHFLKTGTGFLIINNQFAG